MLFRSLSRFKARGGKLIQYHGWHDAVVAPHTSPNYAHALAQFERLKDLTPAQFDDAVERLSAADVAAAAQSHAPTVQQYHRLFMLPNVGHCRGGNGPSTIGGGTGDPPPALRNADTDVVLALARWVEQGVAPEAIVATSFKDGAVLRVAGFHGLNYNWINKQLYGLKPLLDNDFGRFL